MGIDAIAGESYHEHGRVRVSATVKEGHMVVEKNGYVNELSIPTASTASVDIKPSAVISTAIVDSSTATVTIAEGAEVKQVVGETTNISGAGSEAAKTNAVVKVQVSNESELKAALDAQKLYIVLTDDISVTAASEAIDAQGDLGIPTGKTEDDYKGLLLNYSVTIDGNGHKLTFARAKSRGLVVNAEGIVVNIKNLTTKDADRGVQMSAPNCTLIADGWVSENIRHYVLNVATIALNPNVTITNSVLTGYGVLNFWASGYSVYVSNSELYGVNNASYNAKGWNDFGTVILEGDTTLQTTDHSSTIDVNIINTKISATTTGQGNKQWCILFNAGCVSNNVKLSGCTLVYNESQNTFLLLDDGEGNALYIDGRLIA